MRDLGEPVTVGTKVSTVLYNRGVGYICAVHGTPAPETVRTLPHGVVSTGGRASYDIVFEDGSYARQLPECILHGVQWKIYPHAQGFADAAMLADLHHHADAVLAEKARREAEATAAFDAEVEALRANPSYSDLIQGDEGCGRLAAKNIRTLMKKAFPKVKFSVRKTHYGSLHVSWKGDAPRHDVEAITNRFKTGYYDTQADCHTSKASPWSKVFGHADYISL